MGMYHKTPRSVIEQPTIIKDEKTGIPIGIDINELPRFWSYGPILGVIIAFGKNYNETLKYMDWIIVKDEPRDSFSLNRETLHIVPEHYIAARLPFNGNIIYY